ncbi:hypothetical protein WJ96_05685 [Burkholderia ubonensis]|uniref:Uncharacterized protein n=1 Tax=Burkholderia ubonensis TaxID=101571 RepID=A0AAW3MXY7_9BURK|nr:hypothetical protein [Burkholderia ubonensis]KVP75248.1 hypothetical protein WJ93_07480 [Burkholderia ubonensis]KVP98061.1 hypothetical protein WJ96_05685 [Burkholderia ubonensis]KVZ92758.1 hypothetical protein WL25_17345 [Burkholderia ubonensis]
MTNERIGITKDKRAVALSHVSEIELAISTLSNALRHEATLKTGLSAEMAQTLLGSAEFRLADLCKKLGVEIDSVRAQEARFARLREAQHRIRELEAQLGAEQTPESIQASLKLMDQRLNHWWDLDGFAGPVKPSFQKYGCQANFSCHLFGDFRDPEAPVSGKEKYKNWLELLRERGFVLVEEDRDWSIVDCDASRDALTQLFSRIPSARIEKVENIRRNNVNSFIVRSVDVYISDIADILKLPAKPSKG